MVIHLFFFFSRPLSPSHHPLSSFSLSTSLYSTTPLLHYSTYLYPLPHLLYIVIRHQQPQRPPPLLHCMYCMYVCTPYEKIHTISSLPSPPVQSYPTPPLMLPSTNVLTYTYPLFRHLYYILYGFNLYCTHIQTNIPIPIPIPISIPIPKPIPIPIDPPPLPPTTLPD